MHCYHNYSYTLNGYSTIIAIRTIIASYVAIKLTKYIVMHWLGQNSSDRCTERGKQ